MLRNSAHREDTRGTSIIIRFSPGVNLTALAVYDLLLSRTTTRTAVCQLLRAPRFIILRTRELTRWVQDPRAGNIAVGVHPPNAASLVRC